MPTWEVIASDGSTTTAKLVTAETWTDGVNGVAFTTTNPTTQLVVKVAFFPYKSLLGLNLEADQ